MVAADLFLKGVVVVVAAAKGAVVRETSLTVLPIFAFTRFQLAFFK